MSSRDARFDGWFFTAVTSTRIYCRPSCPALTPKRENVRFYTTAAAAQAAGFRACRRCRPDASPGSPEWNVRGDVVARAMRLIADGTVDRDGVSGLARHLGYSERHLHRLLVDEVGTGPIALARAQRAQTARLLLETTSVAITDIAFAAGFASVRQFNDTIRAVFAATPTELRAGHRRNLDVAPGAISLRLAAREPFDGAALLEFLGTRAVAGIEHYDGATYRRSLRLPGGAGVVALTAHPGHVRALLTLESMSDLTAAVARCRRLADLDADPNAIAEHLGADRLLRPLVLKAPGLRVPGAVDGAELATRAILGQQVSVSGARTLARRLVDALGTPLAAEYADANIRYLFPDAAALAEAGDDVLAMPHARRATLRRVMRALADGALSLHPGADRAEAERRLLATAGIGPWTAGYIAMRALGDPDILLARDLGVRQALRTQTAPPALTEQWRPWRSYATVHLWNSLKEQ